MSLDIETTADDERGSIISIGLVNLQTREDIYRVVDVSKGAFCKPAAFEVNGFDLRKLGCRDLVSRDVLDLWLHGWIPAGAVPFGRGISYFDMKFIKKDLPLTAARFNRRIFDLWGYMYGVSQTESIEPCRLYELAKHFAEEKIQQLNKNLSGWGPHHALYDAWENVFVLEYLNGI